MCRNKVKEKKGSFILLDPRFRGDDGRKELDPRWSLSLRKQGPRLVPAEAGNQIPFYWLPACAGTSSTGTSFVGMTMREQRRMINI